MLLPTKDYKPGKLLPPHLSPFINAEEEGYLTGREKELRRIKGEEIS